MGLLSIVKRIAALDLPAMEHDAYARPRPYPYDVTVALPLIDGGAGNTFPAGYTQLIPVGTYDFGDSPNYIQLVALNLEGVSAADTYLIEFAKSSDGATFIVQGAARMRLDLAFIVSSLVLNPGRPINNDTMGVYGRLKSATGGRNIDISLVIARWLPVKNFIPQSAGVWPWR